MLSLMQIIYSMASVTLAGVAIVVSLTLGYDTLQPILIAAAAGAVAALPVSWLVTNQISGR